MTNTGRSFVDDESQLDQDRRGGSNLRVPAATDGVKSSLRAIKDNRNQSRLTLNLPFEEAPHISANFAGPNDDFFDSNLFSYTLASSPDEAREILTWVPATASSVDLALKSEYRSRYSLWTDFKKRGCGAFNAASKHAHRSSTDLLTQQNAAVVEGPFGAGPSQLAWLSRLWSSTKLTRKWNRQQCIFSHGLDMYDKTCTLSLGERDFEPKTHVRLHIVADMTVHGISRIEDRLAGIGLHLNSAYAYHVADAHANTKVAGTFTLTCSGMRHSADEWSEQDRADGFGINALVMIIWLPLASNTMSSMAFHLSHLRAYKQHPLTVVGIDMGKIGDHKRKTSTFERHCGDAQAQKAWAYFHLKGRSDSAAAMANAVRAALLSAVINDWLD